MDWSLATVYLGCAVAGGAVLLIQTVLLLIGGGDHDAPHADAHPDIGLSGSGESPGHDAGLGLLSIRSLAAFVCFFGLTGMYGAARGWSGPTTLFTALGVGCVMLLIVAWIFSLQRKLFAAGNVVPANAVGRTARVYLKIPGENQGKGKVTVAMQGRTVEYSALTKGAEIPTGAEVKVLRLVTEDTFEVERVV